MRRTWGHLFYTEKSTPPAHRTRVLSRHIFRDWTPLPFSVHEEDGLEVGMEIQEDS
jgi:hypothetical protein